VKTCNFNNNLETRNSCEAESGGSHSVVMALYNTELSTSCSIKELE